MHWSRVAHIVLLLCFAAAAGVVAIRVWTIFVRRPRQGDSIGNDRWRFRMPGWVISAPICAALAAGCAILAVAAALTGWHWLRETRGAKHQQHITLDLHIPNLVPGRTYTVIAKFGANGRPYVSQTPLHIHFSKQEPSYRVVLYYDAKNPAVNSWVPLQPPRATAINKIFLLLIGAMICLFFFVEALGTRRERFAMRQESEIHLTASPALDQAQDLPLEISEKS